jgi:uncharacterized protein YegL
MPQLNDHSMADQTLPTGQYGFSATRLSHLGASEYTLVTIVTDVSPSVSGFVKEMENALREIITACKYSPRADNLMLRLVTFSGDMQEAHGFKLLEQCRLDDYKSCLKIGSATALYDAAENCITAMNVYGKQLTDADFGVNGIVFVITDGEDNASTLGVRQVREALERATKTEAMQSMISILVGVNVQDRNIGAYLQDFKTEAGFTHYVEIGQANARALAKLADFVSRFISSQSQALGSGAQSASLTF